MESPCRFGFRVRRRLVMERSHPSRQPASADQALVEKKKSRIVGLFRLLAHGSRAPQLARSSRPRDEQAPPDAALENASPPEDAGWRVFRKDLACSQRTPEDARRHVRSIAMPAMTSRVRISADLALTQPVEIGC